MSLPHFKVLTLAITLGISTTMIGCSTFSKKKQVVDTGPQSTEQVYYQQAIKALDKGQYNEASKQLEALNRYYPTSAYNQQAILDLMYTKFKQANYEEAVKLAERFIAAYPQHPQVDYAYYLRGVANMELNYDSILRYTSLQQAHRDVSYLKLAYQNFADFIRRFPSSQYAVDAAQRMKFITQELAESEMNAARFNLERKAWVAALQRGRWVLEHYPETPQIPEAIATIAYAYQKLGDTQSADQYIKLLQANYPSLIKSNGEVNLNAARHKATWINRLSLGIFGRASKSTVATNNSATQPQTAPNPTPEKRSWLNKLSFGKLGKSE